MSEYTIEWYDGVTGAWYPWESYITRQEALDAASDPTLDTPEKMRLVTTTVEEL